MNRLFRPLQAVFVGSLLVLSLACGGGSGDGGGGGGASADGGTGGGGGGGGGAKKATGEGPCGSADECVGDVCVALIDGDNPPNYCTEPCGDCPSDFFCDSETFAIANLSFCRFGDTPTGPAPTPEEPPSLPCTSDESCEPGLVCATYEGERECSLPCTAEEQCTIESQGVTLDLLNCAPDQTAGENRDVCLPDPDCYPNVTDCIVLPF